MSDSTGPFLFVLFCLALFIGGAITGDRARSENERSKAVAANVGRYVIDDEGQTEFIYGAPQCPK